MTTQTTIEQKLGALHPKFLRVENESHRHNVPPNSESHFKVTIVSPQFTDQPLLARHRMVNQLLAQELSASVHALALHTLTPTEWATQNKTPDSPLCLGGSAAEKQQR